MCKHLDDDSGLFVMPDEPKFLMPNRVYDVLKWLVVIVLPALAVLVSHIGGDFGIADPDRVSVHITEIALFIGTCIGASQVSAMGR